LPTRARDLGAVRTQFKARTRLPLDPHAGLGDGEGIPVLEVDEAEVIIEPRQQLVHVYLRPGDGLGRVRADHPARRQRLGIAQGDGQPIGGERGFREVGGVASARRERDEEHRNVGPFA